MNLEDADGELKTCATWSMPRQADAGRRGRLNERAVLSATRIVPNHSCSALQPEANRPYSPCIVSGISAHAFDRTLSTKVATLSSKEVAASWTATPHKQRGSQVCLTNHWICVRCLNNSSITLRLRIQISKISLSPTHILSSGRSSLAPSQPCRL